MTKELIPEITDERITEMLKTITPLVRKRDSVGRAGASNGSSDKPLHRIELPEDIGGTSFIWSPKFLDVVDESKLQLLRLLPTYHTAGYVALCKPSIAEVLAQIPDELVSLVAAFEVCLDDGIVQLIDNEYFHGHRLVTILYQHRPAQV